MRPNSRGSLGTSGGAPPGTSAARPGSGRPPGTASRLRTGMAPSGPGTMAAGGIALQANVNVSERPVTGQGMMGMKSKGAGGGRIVEDASYYVGLLRKRIGDLTTESQRLRQEHDQNSKDSAQYIQLERKYEALLKAKEGLEGQLADNNLAMDKIRTHADPDDVQHLANHLYEKNRQAGQELDRVFALKKQKESETQDIEDQIDAQYRAIEGKLSANEETRRSYHDLLTRQREMHERNKQLEQKLSEVNNRIGHLEADDESTAFRKEFASLSKRIVLMKKDVESLQEELEIAVMEPKEAHGKFMARVNDLKKLTKDLDERVKSVQDDIHTDKKLLEEMSSTLSPEDQSEASKYELLEKRNQEMTTFMSQFEETRSRLLDEQREPKEMIVALLEHISKDIEDSTNLPSQEALGEMNEARNFKERNLATAQKTMESLQTEHKKLRRDLEGLQASEPKIKGELDQRRAAMATMRDDMEAFSNVEGLKRAFEETKTKLLEQKSSYIKKRDNMRQQCQSLTSELDLLKRALTNNEIAKDLDETEKRLRQQERAIFDAKEFIEVKGREIDYEPVKISCLKTMEKLNALAIKGCQGSGVFAPAQAKY